MNEIGQEDPPKENFLGVEDYLQNQLTAARKECEEAKQAMAAGSGQIEDLQSHINTYREKIEKLEAVMVAAQRFADRKNDMKDYPWPGEIDNLEEALAAAKGEGA